MNTQKPTETSINRLEIGLTYILGKSPERFRTYVIINIVWLVLLTFLRWHLGDLVVFFCTSVTGSALAILTMALFTPPSETQVNENKEQN